MLAARKSLLAQFEAAAVGLAFAAFVAAKGIPTLRHDWNWPIDRTAIASFLNESTSGWLATGFGVVNAHPTPYLLAWPIASVMWLFGPLVALALVAFATGYVCMRACASLSAHWSCARPAAVGIGLFAVFNPWVYNEVVAGHLTMVLAYAAFIGMIAEMLRGASASPVRLALWLALIESQLQFFILAMLALAVFGSLAKKWLPLAAGTIFILPSIVGVIAERAKLLAIPYTVSWQANQSVDPISLLGLTGYFTGYADRLGLAAEIAVWTIVAVACLGLVLAARRSAPARWAFAAALVLYVAILGVRGPAAIPYEWLVRHVPESGVFRELYDLAGLFAALLALLACAAVGAYKPLRYLAAGAGAVLLVTWMLQPPARLWIGASSYPHPAPSAAPFSRVAFLPAFQPVGLRAGGGAGADPDAFVRPGGIAPVNEYLPTYPVDMALARYVRDRDDSALRGLGVEEIVNRPWLTSRSNGTIGLAARYLAQPEMENPLAPAARHIRGATPLISACESPRVGALADRLGACNVFFGDAASMGANAPAMWRGYTAVRPVEAQSDSIDPRAAWIDARLTFAEVPSAAQALGGALTQSRLPHRVEPGSTMLVYVAGRLLGSDGRVLMTSPGALRWLSVPAGVDAVTCVGLCELAAVGAPPGALAIDPPASPAWTPHFRALAPWCFLVSDGSRPARLLRLNQRYDPAWIAIGAGHVLAHVRVDMAANGWIYRSSPPSAVLLVQVTAFLQFLAEILGALCVLWLLKALARSSPKRVR